MKEEKIRCIERDVYALICQGISVYNQGSYIPIGSTSQIPVLKSENGFIATGIPALDKWQTIKEEYIPIKQRDEYIQIKQIVRNKINQLVEEIDKKNSQNGKTDTINHVFNLEDKLLAQISEEIKVI